MLDVVMPPDGVELSFDPTWSMSSEQTKANGRKNSNLYWSLQRGIRRINTTDQRPCPLSDSHAHLVATAGYPVIRCRPVSLDLSAMIGTLEMSDNGGFSELRLAWQSCFRLQYGIQYGGLYCSSTDNH